MNSRLECIPCFMDLVLDVTEALEVGENQRKKVVEKALAESREIVGGRLTPVAVGNVLDRVEEVTGEADPYAQFKRDSTGAALALLARLREVVLAAEDPLRRALEVAATGNALDLVDIDASELGETLDGIENSSGLEFAIDEYDSLSRQLSRAERVLVVGDNAGESVFDRLLLEQIEAEELSYMVRGRPVLNDATELEARRAGLDEEAELLSTGQRLPGLVYENLPEPSREAFEQADVVIAKGQGNFESMGEVPHEVYHLLKLKCDVVAEHLGCSRDDFVLTVSEA